MPLGVLKKHCPSPVDLSTPVWKGTTVALFVSRRDSLGTQNRNRESDYGVWGETLRTSNLEAWQFLAVRGGGTFEWLAFLSRVRSPQYSKISAIYWCPITSTGRWHRPNSTWPSGSSCDQCTLGGPTTWFRFVNQLIAPNSIQLNEFGNLSNNNSREKCFWHLWNCANDLIRFCNKSRLNCGSSLSSYTFILEALFYAASY